MQEPWVQPWVGKIPWSRKWQPTPAFLPGEFRGQRTLAGYGPCGRTESNRTECLRREVGQNIKDKKGDKRARDVDPSREGSLNRGSFQSPGNPRTGGSGGRFSNLGGQPNWEEQLRTTDYVPKSNSQQKSTPDPRTGHQQVGAEWRGVGGIA